MANWNPGPGGAEKSNAKLFSTEAKDSPAAVTGSNELKQFEGKARKPKGPFGLKGKEF